MGNIGHLALSSGQTQKALSKGLDRQAPEGSPEHGNLETAVGCHVPKDNLKDSIKFEAGDGACARVRPRHSAAV